MNNYLLFIDTETNGLPKKWNKPYDNDANWPHIIQIAWIICTKDGTEIRKENHLILNKDFKLKDSAIKIHGITEDYLKEHGKARAEVMQILANDINQYKPMLIGHFMELDLHMINAGFYRSSIENPLQGLPLFCTMLASKNYAKNPSAKYLRLPDFYSLLLNKKTTQSHDALSDAENTAAIFFELLKRGDINDAEISAQQQAFIRKEINEKRASWLLVTLISFIIILFICLYYAS